MTAPTRRDPNALPGQDLAALLGGIGATAPGETRPRERAERAKRERLTLKPRRGMAGRYGGRTPVLLRDDAYRGSTGQVSGIYPFLHGAGLPAVGAQMGINMHTGAAFSCHPVEWLIRGIITNPNMLVSGIPGSGKSATLKALAFRLMCYGVSVFIAGDLKNEYAPLARALGVTPLELGPGLPERLNPLDSGPLGKNLPADPAECRRVLDEIHRRRTALLIALFEMRLHRAVSTSEEFALSLAIRDITGQDAGTTHLIDPTLPAVYDRMRDPSPEMVQAMRIDGSHLGGTDVAAATQNLRELTRPVTDALANLLHGSLAGVFDGPTTVELDFDGPMQTVDLSRIHARGDEDSIAMALSCVSSWAQAAIDVDGGRPRMVIRDEVWRQLRIPAMVRKVDSDLRLSRAQGTIQVLATHEIADFSTVGTGDSAEVAIAKSLISKCAIRVLCQQDVKPLREMRDTIGLTDSECDEIGRWSGEGFLGWGLWKVGSAGSHVVKVTLTDLERQLFHTNERMTV